MGVWPYLATRNIAGQYGALDSMAHSMLGYANIEFLPVDRSAIHHNRGYLMTFASTSLIGSGPAEWGQALENRIRQHKGKYIFQAIIFILGGIIAAALPGIAALNVELLVGAVLLVTGIFQFALTLRSHIHWWSLLSATLSILISLFMLWKPFAVLAAFVTLIAVFLTVEGVLEIFLALRFRPLKSWRWMMMSGLAALVMAFVLWIGFPVFDVMYLGWLVAVNLILYGFSLLMLVWKVAS